jgi:outer membrane protein assembly factor BamB
VITGLELRRAQQGSPPATRITALDLASGRALLATTVDGVYESLSLDERTLALLDVGGLVSFDLASGRQLWNDSIHTARSPVVTSRAVVVWERNELVAYDRNTGGELWRVQFKMAAVA